MPKFATGLTADHLKVIATLSADRLAALPIDKLLLYLIDEVDAEALPWLAWQFNVAGLRGYRLAPDDAARREVIKTAIELNRYGGTPFAVKDALRRVGFPKSDIREHTGFFYDAVHDYGDSSSQSYGSGTWANFIVIVDLGPDKGISVAQTEFIEALINEWKNARSVLEAIYWQAKIEEDPLEPEDELEVSVVVELEDQLGNGLVYNIGGGGLYNGVSNYDGYSEIMEVTEL